MCVITHVLGVTKAASPGLCWSQPVWWGRNAETEQGCGCFWTDICSSWFHLVHYGRNVTHHSAINLNDATMPTSFWIWGTGKFPQPVQLKGYLSLTWNAEVNLSSHWATGKNTPSVHNRKHPHLKISFFLSFWVFLLKHTRKNIQGRGENTKTSERMAWNGIELGTFPLRSLCSCSYVYGSHICTFHTTP